MDLREAIESKNFTLSVVGTGRVGLPLLAAYAGVGVHRIVGIDTNSDLTQLLQGRKVPFREEGLQELWERLDHSRIHFTKDLPQGIQNASVIIVAVGTPLTTSFRPDMNQVQRVVESILERSTRECLLILRSTMVPCFTKNIVLPILRELGRDWVHLAVCPERIAEGYALRELRELPEILGTVEGFAADCAEAFFNLLNPEKLILRTDPTTAETAKILSNVFRYMNFAIANDFAMISETLGVDAVEVIRIANTGYKRGGVPMPGPSGGPCLSKDGHFLPPHTPFAELVKTAWHLNESVPAYVVAKIASAFGSLFGVRVGVLGLAFKAGSDDTRDSPSLRLIDELRREGATVIAYDPYVPGSGPLKDLSSCSVVILSSNHPEFAGLEPDDFPSAKLFYDMWNQLRSKQASFEKARIKYMAFGRGV